LLKYLIEFLLPDSPACEEVRGATKFNPLESNRL
jgi:hypothetical protein